MATLRGAARLTEPLQEAASRLHEQLTEGDVDFTSLTELADRVGEAADEVATTFARLDEILLERVLGRDDEEGGEKGGEGGQRQGRSSGRNGEAEATREDLLERATEADIPGRSSMSKDELQKALDKIEGKSKDELLEQARKLGIPGRSSMTKDELRDALRAEAHVSKDELLERAREAGVAGRSEMTKDELRKALRS